MQSNNSLRPNLQTSFDIVILGGGPAGAATAIRLKQHAPELSVSLVESSDYSEQRVGETLASTASPLLRQLTVWEEFESSGSIDAQGTRACWGQSQPRDNDFIFSLNANGWHIDRPSFDAMLAHRAGQLGVSVFSGYRFLNHRRHGRHNITIRDPEGNRLTIEAGFVVDATGSKASFARRQTSRSRFFDRLVGVYVFIDGNSNGPPIAVDSFALVEACEYGWWYSARLPDNRLVIACMTDVDLLKKENLGCGADWLSHVRQIVHTNSRIHGRRIDPDPKVFVASSRRLEEVIGNDWLAVGDACSTFDPLSGQGIIKALRSGVLAAYAISDHLRGDPRALPKYEKAIKQEFSNYLMTKRDYYRQEQRWSDSLFWRRRQELISLGPRQKLQVNPAATRNPVLPQDHMLSPVDLKEIRAMCRKPREAQEVVMALKKKQWKNDIDQQIIYALQCMIDTGILALWE